MKLPLSYCGHIVRKRFGQNFLIDQAVIAAIIGEIAPKENDLICEIGPGLGALTGRLLDAMNSYVEDHPLPEGKLIAIEIDRDLTKRLEQMYGDKVKIFSCDALQFNFNDLSHFLFFGQEHRKLRIVGNLPYNISSPLLFHLQKSIHLVSDQHFMLQKEVVDRIVARPGSKLYGKLSVVIQQQYNVEKVFDVHPSAFHPVPKVTSSIVRMIPRASEERNQVNFEVLNLVLNQAFSQRRKKLRNSLSTLKSMIAWEELKIDLDKRPEQLTVEEYVSIANGVNSRIF